MKKTISIILALMMFVSLFSGCGAAGNDTTSPDCTDDNTTQAGDSENTDNSEDNELVLGEINADAYTNSFAELSFTLPEGWVFATETELEEMMGSGSEVIYGDDQQAAIEYAMSATVYDMMAQKTEDGANIIVMLENTAMYEDGTDITEEEYLAALEQSIASAQTAYSFADVTTKVTMNDYEYTVLESEIVGYSAYQSYYVRRIGKYMLCICFTGYEANPGSAMQGYFE
ncbi:MAG: hypothetical protein EOM14_04725 [Clostridia bacterium]|nr:hypothetical protein [Clostridia bacterium]